MEVNINGIDGYTVTYSGHIFSLNYNHTGRKQELLGYTDKDGYNVILIKNKQYPNGIKLKRYRIVAEHFVPNPDDLPMVNHKDTNKQNDDSNNLEWCTNTYNQQYASTNESFDHIKQHVVQLDKFNNIIGSYNSISEASRITKICRIGITNCIGGKQHMAGGFIWKKGGDVNHGK